jgi:hypothetical protein
MKKPKMLPISVITLEASERMYQDQLSRLPQYQTPTNDLGLAIHRQMVLVEDAHIFAHLDHEIYGQPGLVIPPRDIE